MSSVPEIIFIIAPVQPEQTVYPAYHRQHFHGTAIVTQQKVGIGKEKEEAGSNKKYAHGIVRNAAHTHHVPVPFGHPFFFKFFQGNNFFIQNNLRLLRP